MSLPRVTVWEIAGAFLLTGMSLALALKGQPTAEELLQWRQAELSEKIASRDLALDPAEVLSLRHNEQVRLYLLDVRSETDFNLFHLIDAIRVPPEAQTRSFVKSIPDKAVKVVLSNDERAANDAWKRLTVLGMVNVYTMAGGINLWLDIYRDGKADARPRTVPGDDTLRHSFDGALGAGWPWSDPDHKSAPERQYKEKMKSLQVVKAPAGGCGG